jgi:hypothetical protein
VLNALKTKLLRKDFFEEFCREFAKETNRLRMEQRAGRSSAKRELAQLETRRKKLVASIMAGVPASEVKDEEPPEKPVVDCLRAPARRSRACPSPGRVKRRGLVAARTRVPGARSSGPSPRAGRPRS